MNGWICNLTQKHQSFLSERNQIVIYFLPTKCSYGTIMTTGYAYVLISEPACMARLPKSYGGQVGRSVATSFYEPHTQKLIYKLPLVYGDGYWHLIVYCSDRDRPGLKGKYKPS